MASETVIQIFWASDDHYSEEASVQARIGHDNWKEVTIDIPSACRVDRLRIDFFSALTIIEIANITVALKSGALLFQAATKLAFEAVALRGDCLRTASDLLAIKITGIDPQLYLPPFPGPGVPGPLVVRMRLRVNSTAA